MTCDIKSNQNYIFLECSSLYIAHWHFGSTLLKKMTELCWNSYRLQLAVIEFQQWQLVLICENVSKNYLWQDRDLKYSNVWLRKWEKCIKKLRNFSNETKQNKYK